MALSKNEETILAVAVGIVAGFLLAWYLLLKRKNDVKVAKIAGAQAMVGRISVEHGKELQAAIDDWTKFEPTEIAMSAVAGSVAAFGLAYLGASLGAGTIGVIALGGLGGAAAVVVTLWYLQKQDGQLVDALVLKYGDEAMHPTVPGTLTPDLLREAGGLGYDPDVVPPIINNGDADVWAEEGAVAGATGVISGVANRLRRALGN